MMNPFIIYMMKAAVYLMAFYIAYLLMLKKDTAHGRNRSFIILTVMSSMFLPLVTFGGDSPLNIQFFGRFLSEVFITPSNIEQPGSVMPGPLHIILTIYILGVILFLLKLIIDIGFLAWLIFRYSRMGSRIIRYNNFGTSGFSAIGYIFIDSSLSQEEEAQIVSHERNHLRQNHYIDIILVELVMAFQWFNPFIYFINRELRALHEFQADRDCLTSGIPVVSYQTLLLSQVFRTGQLKLTNSFSNPSLIKKRMIMMTRKPSSRLAWLKLLSVIPVAGLVMLTVSANPPADVTTNEKPGEEIPFIVVEQMPQFKGGDAMLLKFIAENTVYPQKSKEAGIQGRVIVRFCVTASGDIEKISILQSVSPELDAEAMRVVGTLPSFQPGMQGGKPVPVWYMVPISFTLK